MKKLLFGLLLSLALPVFGATNTQIVDNHTPRKGYYFLQVTDWISGFGAFGKSGLLKNAQSKTKEYYEVCRTIYADCFVVSVSYHNQDSDKTTISIVFEVMDK